MSRAGAPETGSPDAAPGAVSVVVGGVLSFLAALARGVDRGCDLAGDSYASSGRVDFKKNPSRDGQ